MVRLLISTRISSSLIVGIVPLLRKVLLQLELLSKIIMEGRKAAFKYASWSVKFQMHFWFYRLQIFVCISSSSSLTTVNNKGIWEISPALGVWGPLHHLGQWECCPCLEQLWQMSELAAKQDLNWKQEEKDEQEKLCLQKSVAKVEQLKPNLKKSVRDNELTNESLL